VAVLDLPGKRSEHEGQGCQGCQPEFVDRSRRGNGGGMFLTFAERLPPAVGVLLLQSFGVLGPGDPTTLCLQAACGPPAAGAAVVDDWRLAASFLQLSRGLSTPMLKPSSQLLPRGVMPKHFSKMFVVSRDVSLRWLWSCEMCLALDRRLPPPRDASRPRRCSPVPRPHSGALTQCRLARAVALCPDECPGSRSLLLPRRFQRVLAQVEPLEAAWQGRSPVQAAGQ